MNCVHGRPYGCRCDACHPITPQRRQYNFTHSGNSNTPTDQLAGQPEPSTRDAFYAGKIAGAAAAETYYRLRLDAKKATVEEEIRAANRRGDLSRGVMNDILGALAKLLEPHPNKDPR